MRALWIEIRLALQATLYGLSRPVRALWIEMLIEVRESGCQASRPVRALWIEIVHNEGFTEEEARRGP